MLTRHRDGLLSSNYFDPRVSIQSAGDMVSHTSEVQILHSAEENTSPYLLSIRNHIHVPKHYQSQPTNISITSHKPR